MSSLDHFAARINAWEREHGVIHHAARARYHAAHTPQLAGGASRTPQLAGGDETIEAIERRFEKLEGKVGNCWNAIQTFCALFLFLVA